MLETEPALTQRELVCPVGLPALLRPFDFHLQEQEEEELPQVKRWLKSRLRLRKNRDELNLDAVLDFFAISQGDFNNPALLGLQKALKLSVFDLLPEGAQIKELGGSVSRLANLYPESASFSAYLPLYLKQQAERLLLSPETNAEHPSEKLAQEVLSYMLTYSLNTDHFLPIEMKNFPLVGERLAQTTAEYLRAVGAQFSQKNIEGGGVEFVVDNPQLFFQGLTTLVSNNKDTEFKPRGICALGLYQTLDAAGYAIKIVPIRPPGNSDWLLYGVLGGPIDAQGNPIFYNLKYFFNPSVEVNPELTLLDQREAPENVSSKQTTAIRYDKTGRVFPSDEATSESFWVKKANILPETIKKPSLMAHWSPLLRVLRERFFTRQLYYERNEEIDQRRPYEKERVPKLIVDIIKMQQQDNTLREQELLEYYSEMVVMAMRSWTYFCTDFADLIRSCLKNGKYLKLNNPDWLLCSDRDYMNIAWPWINHQTPLSTNWETDPSPVERIVFQAEANGFRPANPQFSPLAKFIELMAPGIPS